MLRRLTITAALCGLLAPFAGACPAAIPGPPAWAPRYQRVWAQDFTGMTTLAQLGVGDTSMGAGTWIAHKPGGGDWFTFQNPTANYHPFGVGNGYLAIRVQKDGHDPNHWFAGYSGGLLSSLDSAGKGFAQQYGYFECSMWTPGSPNTWPAFWLLDAPSVTDRTLSAAEIDITESYGNWGTGPGQKPPGDPNEDSVTWHLWGSGGKPTAANGSFAREPGMTTGFHTYGADVEPTGITWYFDRKKIWWAPIYPEAMRPLYVLLNLALGGGNHNNAKGDDYNWNLTPDPTDLKVQYVAVWASPASPNYAGPPSPASDLKGTPGNKIAALSWSPALGADTYDVYRGKTVAAWGIKTTSYIDRNVDNDHAYSYTVVAVGAKGRSAASPAVTVTPRFAPPIRPTNLHAAAGDRTVTLTWDASPDAEGYRLYRGAASGLKEAQPAAVSRTTSYVDRGLKNGVPYFYTVAAVSTAGVSQGSNEANAIPASSAETIAVSYTEKPPALDAKLDAVWGAASAYPIIRLGLGQPTTTSGAFRMLWDTANLYYLFTIDDDSLVSGAPDYNGDAVEMYIDTRNTKGARYDDADFKYILGYDHAAPRELAHGATAGVRFAKKTYPGGYQETVAIPWSALGAAPFPGMSLGLDAAIDEAPTAARGRTAALFWHDSTANDYQNPSLFGNGTLQPPHPPAPLSGGIYAIINAASGKALDVPGASLANVPLDQAAHDGGVGQQWIVTDLGGGSYSVQNVKSRSVVDCSPTFDEGHPVVQWPINGTPSATQRFTITPLGGHYLLTNVFSGKALDVAGSSTADHAAIIQSACKAKGSQLWDLKLLGAAAK